MDISDPAIQERIQRYYEIFGQDHRGPRDAFVDADIRRKATSQVELEEALSLLNYDQQLLVEVLANQMEYCLTLPDLHNNIYGRTALDDFTHDQRDQVIGYLEGTVFRGEASGNILVDRMRRLHACRWDPRIKAFRIVRIDST